MNLTTRPGNRRSDNTGKEITNMTSKALPKHPDQLTPDEVAAFITEHHPDLVRYLGPDDPARGALMAFARDLYRDWAVRTYHWHLYADAHAGRITPYAAAVAAGLADPRPDDEAEAARDWADWRADRDEKRRQALREQDAREGRVATLRHPDLHHWWLSFVDRIDHMVACQLGVAIVSGRDMADAVQNAWDYNCNPGGEVMAQQLPHRSIPKHLTYRLLTDPGDLTEAQLFIAEAQH